MSAATLASEESFRAAADKPKTPNSVELRLTVTDGEVTAELLRHPDGERETYALAALRLGVMSLRLANGYVDANSVREAGQTLLGDLREVLATRGAELTGQVSAALGHYFDATNGALPRRLRALLEDGGELEDLLRRHLASDESTLARTLAAHLGEGSPIFKMLSPTDANGLKSQLATTIQTALAEQRNLVLREFTLDNKQSALSRFLAEIGVSQGELKTDLKNQVNLIIREFSLDVPTSGLSRLVGKVEAAQREISGQFSADNEKSALNRLSRLLEGTSARIDQNLTLDDEQSSLARLRKELLGTIEGMVRNNRDFHGEVKATMAGLVARRDEQARSTVHGTTFEVILGDALSGEAQRLGDVYAATGTTVGSIRNCKTGDHVTQLGPDSTAAGARIVWEAKEDKNYDLVSALEEIERARKNRDAQVGIFVFSRKTAPAGLQPFMRYASDIVVVWDADDPKSDVYVKAAYSVARALSIRVRKDVSQTQDSLRGLEQAARAVEKQVQHLDQIKTWSETIKGHGEKIGERVAKMKVELLRETERLDREVAALKTGQGISEVGA
jgi:hypothetical protein